MATTQPSRESRVRELDLIGKVAIVTGGSRGIGRGIAFHLASRGCSVLGTCTGDAGITALATLDSDVTEKVYEATGRSRPAGQKIKGLVADIFSADCAHTIADEIGNSFGGHVDIFVSSAGDPMPGTIGEMGVDEIQRSLLGNVQTPILIVEEFVRRRCFRPDSRIIYISSIRSRQPWAGQLMYAAGKSAGESLCRTWAHAFGGKEDKVRLCSALP